MAARVISYNFKKVFYLKKTEPQTQFLKMRNTQKQVVEKSRVFASVSERVERFGLGCGLSWDLISVSSPQAEYLA